MLRAILLGLDGSAYSQSATQLATVWAKKHQAVILAVGIVDEPGIRRPEPVPIGAGYFKQHLDEVQLREAVERVSQILQECEHHCQREQVVCKRVVCMGEPWEQIVREAQRCDVIVLGKQTYFRFETREEPCDTLERVLRHSPRPVVTVPEQLPDREAVLVAYDGTIQATRALQLFTLLGLGQGRKVLVCSVHRQTEQAARWAELAGEFLGYHGIEASLHPVGTSAATAEVLIEEADTHQVGMMVAGAYGQPVIKEFFIGSVTKHLLREAHIPLFLYH